MRPLLPTLTAYYIWYKVVRLDIARNQRKAIGPCQIQLLHQLNSEHFKRPAVRNAMSQIGTSNIQLFAYY